MMCYFTMKMYFFAGCTFTVTQNRIRGTNEKFLLRNFFHYFPRLLGSRVSLRLVFLCFLFGEYYSRGLIARESHQPS